MKNTRTPLATLKTKAIATCNGKRYEHDVILLSDERYDTQYGPTLHIVHTPGSWFVSTLTERADALTQKNLWIDYGQGWLCINADELIREALEILNPQPLNYDI